MTERRRSPMRRPLRPGVRLPGLCTESGCRDAWLIETPVGRLCRTHRSAFLAASSPLDRSRMTAGSGDGATWCAEPVTSASPPKGRTAGRPRSLVALGTPTP